MVSANDLSKAYSLSAFASREETEKPSATADAERGVDTASDSGSAGQRSMRSMSQRSNDRDDFVRPASVMDASPASVAPPAPRRKWRGEELDGYLIVGEYEDAQGNVWLKRRDKSIGREHYFNPASKVREDEKSREWRVVDVDSDESIGSESEREDEDDGVEFTSLNGERWTKYYEKSRNAYFYVNSTTNGTTWEHPDGDFGDALVSVGFTALGGGPTKADVENAELDAQKDAEMREKREIISHDERIDTKFTKLCLVNERWLEKYPPVVAVPSRPRDFKGVYGEEAAFWDPEADSHSVDNNEGSERGDNLFDDAYEAEGSLARFTSAVDLATPEELRPLSVARAYVDSLLNAMFDLVDDDEHYARARKTLAASSASMAASKVSSASVKVKRMPSTKKSSDVIVATVNAHEASELSKGDEFEKRRAAYRNTIGDERLKFDREDDDIDETIFRRRLHAPYNLVISTALHIKNVAQGDDSDENSNDAASHSDSHGYSDSEGTRKELVALRASKTMQKSATTRRREAEDARIEAESQAVYAAAQKSKEENVRERRGLIAFLGRSMSTKARAKVAKVRAVIKSIKREQKLDAKALADANYVEPWQKHEERKALHAQVPISDSESDESASDFLMQRDTS